MKDFDGRMIVILQGYRCLYIRDFSHCVKISVRGPRLEVRRSSWRTVTVETVTA